MNYKHINFNDIKLGDIIIINIFHDLVECRSRNLISPDKTPNVFRGGYCELLIIVLTKEYIVGKVINILSYKEVSTTSTFVKIEPWENVEPWNKDHNKKDWMMTPQILSSRCININDLYKQII